MALLAGNFVKVSYRNLQQVAKRRVVPRITKRRYICSAQLAQRASGPDDGRTTHFGFETVSEAEKEEKG